MKKIFWLIVGVALFGLLIGAYFGTTQMIGTPTEVERQSLDEALQESLGDAYYPNLVDIETAP